MTCREGHAPKHPDFAEGNTVAMKAGAHSPRVVSPLAAELAAVLVAQRPDLAEHEYSVMAWARTEVQAGLLRSYIDEHGLVDEKGKPRDAMLRHLASFERLASTLRDRLGLDPRSQAALARERMEATRTAFDLEAFQADGRAIIEQRERAELQAAREDSDESG